MGEVAISEISCRNYLQDESVLIQLILNEYLEACKSFKSPLRLLKKKFKKVDWRTEDLDRIIDAITPGVTALAGTARRVLFPIPWKNQLGHLEKLEDYCYLLVLHSERNNPTYFTLHQEIQGARVMAKQMMRIMQLWDCQSSFFLETFDIKYVYETLEELCDRIKNIADALSIALRFSDKNEHVILYFLRNYRQLTNYLGRRFMRDTLFRMMPHGTKENAVRSLSQMGQEELKAKISQIVVKANS